MITTVNNFNKPAEFRGLSGDTKPVMGDVVNGVQNGSIFFEMDTGLTYMYSSKTNEWLEVNFSGLTTETWTFTTEAGPVTKQVVVMPEKNVVSK